MTEKDFIIILTLTQKRLNQITTISDEKLNSFLKDNLKPLRYRCVAVIRKYRLNLLTFTILPDHFIQQAVLVVLAQN